LLCVVIESLGWKENNMKKLGILKRVIATLVLAVAAGSVAAVPITVPVALNPGESYRLAFVTSTSRDATSADIADYNAFVTAVANTQAELAALGTTWMVIGSTPTVDARDNTGTATAGGVPIFLLNDVSSKIADDYADLWDGGLDATLDIRENGLPGITTFVHTGTAIDGTGLVVGPTGYQLGSVLRHTIGGTGTTGNGWVDSGIYSGNTSMRPLYAISGVLTVPVPVPSVLALLLVGLACIGYQRRKQIQTA
jgi:hypothetical protein